MSRESGIAAGTFGDAWRAALNHVMTRGSATGGPLSESSPGAKLLTIVPDHPMVISVMRARAAFLVSRARPLKWAFPLGNFLYLISGSNLVRDLGYYNERAGDFSDDGVTLHGTYGPRLLIPCRGREAQLEHVMSLLRRDPQTRRAVMTFYDPDRDFAESRDIPCVLSMQLFRRRGHLDGVVSMRSLNLFMVFPYDYLLFAMLLDHIAAQIGIDSGALHFTVNVPHVYQSDVISVARELGGSDTSTVVLGHMDYLSAADRSLLLAWERHYRAMGSGELSGPPPPQTLTGYWGRYAECLSHLACGTWSSKMGAGPIESFLSAKFDS